MSLTFETTAPGKSGITDRGSSICWNHRHEPEVFVRYPSQIPYALDLCIVRMLAAEHINLRKQLGPHIRTPSQFDPGVA
jgi:hypothetical protein